MKKILVIDDEPHMVMMIKSRLEANNYEVISASNGKEGLEKIPQEKPDLIIVDVLMPEMDGYTFVRKLKIANDEIPIIVLTAKPGMADLFAEEGITDYLYKPFETEELLSTVEQMIAGTLEE